METSSFAQSLNRGGKELNDALYVMVTISSVVIPLKKRSSTWLFVFKEKVGPNGPKTDPPSPHTLPLGKASKAQTL